MTTVNQQTPTPEEEEAQGALARYLHLQKAEGLLAPLITALLAFLIGGAVVFATTKSVPDVLQTYRAIFEGAGLDWFLPWNTCQDPCVPAIKLEQTLLVWVPLVLTGLAVAFAFRCGLFNIGGQGQYLAGAIASVIIAAELPLHVDLSALDAHRFLPVLRSAAICQSVLHRRHER